MGDFNSEFWPWYIFILVTLSFVGMFWLIRWMSSSKEDQAKKEHGTTGHQWDGLEELNTPMPSWWLKLFYGSLFFGIIYLILYPGLGLFQGVLGWSSKQRYENEMKMHNERVKPMFEAFRKRSIADLAKDEQAMKTAARIFFNNCTTCHGSDAGGAKGFPSLRDKAWLWGGSPAQIKHSILNGRKGTMPAWKAALPGEKLEQVTQYVLSLSGRKHDSALAAKGKASYAIFCASCHQANGKGDTAKGYPNLTDKAWLHGRSDDDIRNSIANGRTGVMPPHKELLGEARVHLLAAYVYSLSLEKKDSK